MSWFCRVSGLEVFNILCNLIPLSDDCVILRLVDPSRPPCSKAMASQIRFLILPFRPSRSICARISFLFPGKIPITFFSNFVNDRDLLDHVGILCAVLPQHAPIGHSAKGSIPQQTGSPRIAYLDFCFLGRWGVCGNGPFCFDLFPDLLHDSFHCDFTAFRILHPTPISGNE